MDDPKDTRMVQTRDGVERIPRTQEGVPMRGYFGNTEFPKDLERAVVYVTRSGPVALDPDPVPWSEKHDEQVRQYANVVRETIDKQGKYASKLTQISERLSTETGYPETEMKALIISAFEAENGKDPFNYLQDVRAERGLPTREKEVRQTPEPEVEM